MEEDTHPLISEEVKKEKKKKKRKIIDAETDGQDGVQVEAHGE